MQSSNKDEEVFHFVTYIPIDGRLYELDGLKEGPIDLGPVAEGQEWLNTVRPIIEKRMQKYNEGEIHFNLMAVVSDRQVIYKRQLDKVIYKWQNTSFIKYHIDKISICSYRMDRRMKWKQTLVKPRSYGCDY